MNLLLEYTRNPHEIRRASKAKLSDIRKMMREHPSDLPGWGNPALHPHIISRRRASASSWPVEDATVIIEHKLMHDQGRVIMCQGRDGDYIIQYAIPVKGRPLRGASYFYGG